MKRKELKIRLSFGQWFNQPAQVLRFQKTASISGSLKHMELPSWWTMTCRAVTHADYLRHRSPVSCCLIFFICTFDNKTLIRTVKIIKAERVHRTISPYLVGQTWKHLYCSQAPKVMAIWLRTKSRICNLMVTPGFTLNYSATFPRGSKQE